MREDFSKFKRRIQAFQMTVLVFMVVTVVIGGSVFGLGVKARPVLRITKPNHFVYVEEILDLMVNTGAAQLITSGFNCFVICWKLVWPLYLAIGLTALTVCLEIAAIGMSLHLLHTADQLVNEDVLHPWFWVECQTTDTCYNAMLSYIYYFILPQIVLSAVAIFLQCMAILYMGRMVRTLAKRTKAMQSYKEWYHENLDDKADPVATTSGTSKTDKKGATPPKLSSIEMTPIQQNSRTALLKVDKGEDSEDDGGSGCMRRMMSPHPVSEPPTPLSFQGATPAKAKSPLGSRDSLRVRFQMDEPTGKDN